MATGGGGGQHVSGRGGGRDEAPVPGPGARGPGRELRLRTGHLLALLAAGVHHEAVVQEALRGPGDLARPEVIRHLVSMRQGDNPVSPLRGEKLFKIVNPRLELRDSP